ncbi:MAG: hypothetical protein HRF45_04170 [Fimbriimonadia bacterium]|jgi:hypothetical protein
MNERENKRTYVSMASTRLCTQTQRPFVVISNHINFCSKEMHMSTALVRGVARLGITLAALTAVVASYALETTAQANYLAYDAYNNNSAPQIVEVEGIVVSPPKFYRTTETPPLAQEGVSFGAMVIQDPSANRNIGGTVYSNAIKVVFGSNYGSIPNGAFPLSFADRQLYGFPREGDRVRVKGYATISYGTISAIFSLTIGNEPIIDMRDDVQFPYIQVLSENNYVAPTVITPGTLAAFPYTKFASSATAGLVDQHSRKGVVGFGQGNLIVNPLLGMLVELHGFKYDMLNPNNIQQSYNNSKVGFVIADSSGNSTLNAAAVFVNTRPSLGTGETPVPIDCSVLPPGNSDPVYGVVNSHLLLQGTDIWNCTGVQARYQSDIAASGGPPNRVTYSTVALQTNQPPLPGSNVDVTVNALEFNPGGATVTLDLGVLGPGGALDPVTSAPITSLVLPPTSPGSSIYKGTFKIGGPARKGILSPIIRYQNTGVDFFLNTSHVFSPVINAVPFKSVAALKAVINNLPDGYPVAIDASIPGTINPIVTCAENDAGGWLSSTSQLWVQDPFVPAGQNIYLPDGNKAFPIAARGDALNVAGTLLNFRGNREINSRTSFVSVVSSGNPVPAPVLMNTNNVSPECHDATLGQTLPASAVPNQGVLATVVGRVVASPSALQGSPFQSWVDIDDGTGRIAIKLDDRYTTEPDLVDWLTVGDTVIATGVLAGNYYSTSDPRIARTLWIRSKSEILKNPPTTVINVPVAAGQQLVTLPAPATTYSPNIIPPSLNARRLFNGTLYTGLPAPGEPWYKGLEFLQLGEAYQINPPGAATNFTYNGLASGTALDIDGNQQTFDLDNLPRWYGMLPSPGSQQLVGISYTGKTVLWDDDGPANQLWATDTGTMQSVFGAPSTLISGLANEAGIPITSPKTFAAGESYRATTKVANVSMVYTPTAIPQTCNLTVEVKLDPQFIGSVNGLPIEVQLRYPGTTTPVRTVTGTLNALGRITISNVLFGVYDVWVKPCGFLAAKSDSVAVTGCPTSIALVDGPLGAGIRAGDANPAGLSYNTVTLDDINVVLLNFGQAKPCPIDLNGSGFVDLPDLNICLVYFGQSGTP